MPLDTHLERCYALPMDITLFDKTKYIRTTEPGSLKKKTSRVIGVAVSTGSDVYYLRDDLTRVSTEHLRSSLFDSLEDLWDHLKDTH